MKKNINQYICNYMNTMAVRRSKEYTLEEVNKLKRSVLLEKEDRSNKNIKINSNVPTGRNKINERTLNIAKTVFKLNITVNDIVLFRKCKSNEAKDRKLIKDLEED